MSFIYHITSEQQLREAETKGYYLPATFEADGFIHLSQKHQVLTVANNFYKGQTGLVCLIIDPEKLNAELKFEPPIHPNGQVINDISPDQMFPHLYGKLNLDAIVSNFKMIANRDGVFDQIAE